MAKSLLRTDKELEEIYERQHRLLYRVCLSLMKNRADAEDAVQETFCRLITKGPAFENETHERAWLLRTAENYCISQLRHWWRRREEFDENLLLSVSDEPRETEVLQAVLELPARLKTVVELYYYEGYQTSEIARMLGRPESTVRNQLRDARKLLKEDLED
ncbi:MAG: RNA polymerase sigma factor [Lachnospiraceae bacterium]|nr:RNA polymerase sigma factor [Lachnospiraceae bacterium]